MTNELNTINLIAKYISDILGDKLLGINYGNNNYGVSLGNFRILEFCNKCVIMVESNTLNSNNIVSSNLYPLINILTNSENCRSLRYTQLKNQDSAELTSFNKYRMSIVLPDLSPDSSNYDPTVAFHTGCQFIGMNFQNFDTNLEFYFNIFDELKYSFVIKPCALRYIPVHYLIDPVPVQATGVADSISRSSSRGGTETSVTLNTAGHIAGLDG